MPARAWLLGDSVSQGVVYDESKQRYVLEKDAFARKVPELLGFTLTNKSAMGATIARGEALLEREAISRGDIVLVEYGGNDCDFDWAAVAADPYADHKCKTPPEVFAAKYEGVIRSLRERGAHPIVLTLPPLQAELYFNWISKGLDKDAIMAFLGDIEQIYRWQEYYSNMVSTIASKLRCPVLDVRGEFLKVRNFKSLLCVDGIHPNAEGHRMLCSAVLTKPCMQMFARILAPMQEKRA